MSGFFCFYEAEPSETSVHLRRGDNMKPLSHFGRGNEAPRRFLPAEGTRRLIPRGAAAWEGEGLCFPLAARALTPPLLTQWVPPSPEMGEGR